MNILAMDTSTSMASLALGTGDRIAAESLFNTDRTLSSRLIPEVNRILGLAGVSADDLDLFAVSVGPGSFTGVRGGVATIQGLALASGRPCAGFSSLALLAMNFPLSRHPVCALLDARKSEVYAGLYDCSASIPTQLLSDCVLPVGLLLDQLHAWRGERVIFLGDGAVRYHEQIVERLADNALFAPFQLNVPHAANGILLALDAARQDKLLEPSQLLPVYLRASDAELCRNKKLS